MSHGFAVGANGRPVGRRGARGAFILHARPGVLAVLAVLLALPSLGLGLQVDDHALMERSGAGAELLDLFRLTPHDVEEGRWFGRFAWWSSAELEVRFFRPLSSLSHALEHALWGQHAWAMHLVNCLLYGLLVAVAALAYRRILSVGVTAGLAGLMFAVDEAHAFSVGWISSRSVVLGSLFALLALLLHVRGRDERAVASRVASPICTGLALLSGEIGVAALAYVAAHALVLEAGSMRARLKGVLPHALVGNAWLAAYVALGCGVRGAGWYRDFRAEPVGSFLQGAADLPVWLFTQLGLPTLNAAPVFPQGSVRLLALLLVLPVLALLVPTLRASKQSRFFAAGMLLSIVPLWATMPQERVLVSASFGAFGWIASALESSGERKSIIGRWGTRALGGVHLGVAPLLFVPMLGSMTGLNSGALALVAALADRGGQRVIIVNVPVELVTLHVRSLCERTGLREPESLHQLYAGGSELTIERVDDRTLEVRALQGWARMPFERVFASASSMPAPGGRVVVSGMRAEVMEVGPNSMPVRVRFQFPEALESSRYRWLVWRGDRPVEWTPPRIGEHIGLPTLSVFTALKH